MASSIDDKNGACDAPEKLDRLSCIEGCGRCDEAGRISRPALALTLSEPKRANSVFNLD
jgi:hypothetical protein